MKNLKILFVLGFLVSCNSFNRSDSFFVSDSTAELFIQNQKIDSFQEVELSADQDSIYRLLSIVPESDQTTLEFFIRRNIDFYIIQDFKIIYQNKGVQFYPNIGASDYDYVFYPDKNKTLYQVKLASTNVVKILFKQSVKHKLKDIFNSAELSDLYQTKSHKSLPWIKLTTLHGISDTSYSEVDVKQNSILLKRKIKIRGSSSKAFPKKQFSLKSIHSSNSIDVIKSVLYAPYIDRSLIRNKLTYDLFSSLSGDSINSYFTHLNINGSYEGIYLMLNHPKTQFKQNSISNNPNSFMVQIDRCPCPIIHDSKIDSFIKPAYIFEIPSKPNKLREVQINEQLLKFEEALYSEDLSAINLTSFVNLIILNELSKNIDAYRLSTYLAFDGAKFSIPTVWDFNIAWGLAKHVDGFEPTGFVIDGVNKNHAPYWWQSLWGNPLFQTELKNTYSKYREGVLSEDSFNLRINHLVAILEEDADLNFKKWPLFGKNIWPNKHNSKSHEDEISNLKEWFKLRIDWLDSQWLD